MHYKPTYCVLRLIMGLFDDLKVKHKANKVRKEAEQKAFVERLIKEDKGWLGQ